ncbi:hypothetical protein AVEN_203199-1 [Araneus ventricosus]|uniref:Uncharacterized protein n=1 Tax=Araneus ventricosus TaxID=182803 RepID=A0A4Y2CK28_ARAVE|nr:hypothetical protein AVEN_203199-1 [Araneus ventricosus]
MVDGGHAEMKATVVQHFCPLEPRNRRGEAGALQPEDQGDTTVSCRSNSDCACKTQQHQSIICAFELESTSYCAWKELNYVNQITHLLYAANVLLRLERANNGQSINVSTADVLLPRRGK